MNKQVLNKILRHFNAEIHGLGYLQALQKGEFSKDVFQVQQELLAGRTIKNIFDVGANRGDVCARYVDLFPGAIVHAFEPFPMSFNTLKQHFGGHPGVICNQAGITDVEATLPFYVNRNEDTNSLLKPGKIGLSSDSMVENQSLIEIYCTTLDLYCSGKGIESIDILKMDIQGGEYKALRGADDLLRRKAISVIYLECYFREQYEQQPLFHDISRLLHSYGYYLQDIYSPIYGKKSLAWSDAVFLPGS